MPRTILVIGATGKTGRRLVPRLHAAGLQVRAASRRPNPGFTRFDWGDPTTHRPALAGADAVYLVAPELVENPSPMVGPFLDLADNLGVERVVLLSSQGAGFPGEDATSGRRTLERRVKDTALDWTILRATGFAQNFSEGFLLPGIVTADAVVTASEDGAVAFVDAEDIAAVAATALLEDGHAKAQYVVTGPDALTFDQAAATISAEVGRTITHQRISLDDMAQNLAAAGVPVDYAAMLLRDMAGTRAGHGAVVTDVVPRICGRPAVGFTDFAKTAWPVWINRSEPVDHGSKFR
jgi:uncharacterized protein YbjT (DUF2867 family)